MNGCFRSKGVTLEGCVVTAGGELTVRLTLDESVGVAQVALVRIAWYRYPLCASVTPVSVRVEALPPEMLVQVVPPLVLTCHW